MSLRLVSAFAALGLSALGLAAEAKTVARDAAPVVVDVSRLRAFGLGPSADLVQETILRQLAQGTAAAAPGSQILVRIIGLSMNAYAGHDGGGGGGESGGMGSGSNNDFLEGEVTVLSPGGTVVQRFPQLLALPASSGGAYYAAGDEQRRVVALSTSFAAWIRRRLG